MCIPNKHLSVVCALPFSLSVSVSLSVSLARSLSHAVAPSLQPYSRQPPFAAAARNKCRKLRAQRCHVPLFACSPALAVSLAHGVHSCPRRAPCPNELPMLALSPSKAKLTVLGRQQNLNPRRISYLRRAVVMTTVTCANESQRGRAGRCVG